MQVDLACNILELIINFDLVCFSPVYHLCLFLLVFSNASLRRLICFCLVFLSNLLPSFVLRHPKFIFQSTPVGMTVYSRVSATDLDEGKNKKIVFTLSKAPGSHVCFSFIFTYVTIFQITHSVML